MSEEPKLAAVEKVEIPEQKVKNPGPVAAGKRLAEISKEAKARKAAERKKAESESIENSNLLYVSVGVLGVVGLGYWVYNFLCKKEEPQQQQQQQQQKVEQPQEKKSNFDDL